MIDGTWPQAHRLYRDNPWIHELPRYRLPEGEPSRYRIRKEPALECLSTIESVVASLRILQPGLEGTGGLIAAFETMINGNTYWPVLVKHLEFPMDAHLAQAKEQLFSSALGSGRRRIHCDGITSMPSSENAAAAARRWRSLV